MAPVATRGERQLELLRQARELSSLGARLRTIHALTGLQPRQLQRMFFPQADRIPRGRAPDSGEWYHQANLIRQVDACVLASCFSHMHKQGWDPVDALIASYRTYQARAHGGASISMDRAFCLISHLLGLWQVRAPTLALDRCQSCACRFLVAYGASTGAPRHCPLCKLRARFDIDPRLRLTFAGHAAIALRAMQRATAPQDSPSMEDAAPWRDEKSACGAPVPAPAPARASARIEPACGVSR